jgi:hypothetical protein
MLRTLLTRRALFASAALALTARLAWSKDGKADAPAPSGTWQKKTGEMKLVFEGDGLTLYPHGDNVNIRVECSCSATRERVVKAKVTGFGGKAEVIEQLKGILPIGTEFRFTWKVDGDTSTLEGLEGKEIEHARDQLEGAYTKKP